MDAKLNQRLEERRKTNTLRKLRSYDGLIDFISNDYLGLSDLQINEMPFRGATGSRLISGNNKILEEVETFLAEFYGYEAALCFNSGYDANLGIFGSIPQKGDVVLYDKAIHASVRDGLRLNFADSYSFEHNSTSDLERLLTKFSNRTVYVVIEGLYSMNGDLAPITTISELCNIYNAELIVDEAHSGGIFGREGKGWTYENASDDNIFIKLITFGKAYGCHGAVVLCSTELKEYLINFARSLIYTTALPINEYVRMKEAVRAAARENDRIIKLQANLERFRKLVDPMLISSDECSPIQILRPGNLERLESLERELLENGIAVKAIFSPTVTPGDECLRVCLHSFNTDAEIEQLISIINK